MVVVSSIKLGLINSTIMVPRHTRFKIMELQLPKIKFQLSKIKLQLFKIRREVK